MSNAESLIHGHRLFRRQYFEERSFLRQLATQGQSPKALYIGCSDSRVIPEYLTSSGFGELFVLRNIANFVPPLEDVDASVGAAIDYAIDYLKVPDVIVCGHYGCGGVKAALGDVEVFKEKQPSLHEWIGNIEPGVKRTYDPSLDAELSWRRGVEENVLQSLANLITYESVKRALENKSIHIHGWLYDMQQTAVRVFDEESGEFVDAVEYLHRP